MFHNVGRYLLPGPLWDLAVNRTMPGSQDNVEIERSGQSLSPGMATPIMLTSLSPDPERIFNLHGRLNYQARVRLGYSKAISVLYNRLEELPNQPSGMDLSLFARSHDIRSLSETLQLLVDALGLEPSVSVLENTCIHSGAVTHDLGGSSGETGMDNKLVDVSGVTPAELFPRAPVPSVGVSSRNSS